MRGLKKFVQVHKPETLFLALVICSVLMLYLSNENASVRPTDIGHSLVAVGQESISTVAGFFSRTVNSVGELRKLKEEYDAAILKLHEYESMEVKYKELEKESTTLRELLGFSKTAKHIPIPAEVIGKDPENFFATITINKGTLDGVKAGMPVVAYQGGVQGLVGKVAKTGLSTSMLIPIFDRNCFVASRLQESRHEGLLNGTGSPENIVMRYVKKFARNDIRYDDYVITSGMNSLYPKDLYIGKVKAIRAKDYDTSLELIVEPVVDFSRLEYVFVLTTGE